MNGLLDQLTSKEAVKFSDSLAKIFADLPHLPEGIVSFLVKIAPWLVGLGGILNIFNALSQIQLALNPTQTVFGQIMAELTSINPLYYWVSALVSILSAGLALLAFSPLKAQQKTGWMYLFWLNMVGIVGSLVNVAMLGGSGIVGSVIGILIGLYLLFEIQPHYSAKGTKPSTKE